MKDSVIDLVEAVRLARLELHCFRDPRCAASAEWTVNRLEHLLLDPRVGEAMMVLAPSAESPSIVPEQDGARALAEERQHG
jgi:hypothetical protein